MIATREDGCCYLTRQDNQMREMFDEWFFFNTRVQNDLFPFLLLHRYEITWIISDESEKSPFLLSTSIVMTEMYYSTCTILMSSSNESFVRIRSIW